MSKNAKGTLTLEMSIVLPFFLFVFLFLFGIFNIIEAQNRISHAFIQGVKSVSLDPYINDRKESYAKESSHMWSDLDDFMNDMIIRRGVDDSYFASKSDWYKEDTTNTEDISRRFIGYLAGGMPDEADRILKGLGVENGIEGMKFTVNIDDKVMTVTVEYELSFWFNFLDFGRIPIKQTIVQRLWTK